MHQAPGPVGVKRCIMAGAAATAWMAGAAATAWLTAPGLLSAGRRAGTRCTDAFGVSASDLTFAKDLYCPRNCCSDLPLPANQLGVAFMVKVYA